MSQAESEEITKVYSALGHPLRKKIVGIIGERQRVGFKDLKDALTVSVGTLYFHLETLGDLIQQDAERKYVLTEKGKLALKFLGSSEEHACRFHRPCLDTSKVLTPTSVDSTREGSQIYASMRD